MFLGVGEGRGARIVRARVGATLSLVLVATIAASPAAASEPPLSLQVVPAELTLDAHGSGQVTVLATNETAASLGHLRLTTQGVSDATVTKSSSGTLRPGETRAFTVDVREPRETAKTLSLLASFKTTSGVSRTIGAGAKIERETAPDPAKLATLEVKASLQALHSGHDQPVFLIVHDVAAQPLHITKVIAKGPDFIKFTKRPENLTVGPDKTTVIRLEAEVEDSVEPGEHQVVFKLPATVGSRRFDLVAGQLTKVSVTGEAELLTVLGVPSLLFLPGFLVIAAASLLWRLRFLRKDWDGAEFPLTFKDPGFWVIAVSISLIAVAVCKLFGFDLFGRYSLRQIIYLWAASIGLGILLYVILVPLRNWRRSALIPAEGDDPKVVLRKLDRQGLSLLRPSFTRSGTPGTRTFLLQPPSETRPSTWGCSAIVYSWEHADDGLNREINHHRDTTRDAAGLADALERGERAGKLTVTFEADGPSLIPKEKIGDTIKELIAHSLD